MYLSSSKVKVFPSAFRGKNATDTIDPESYLTSEGNFTSLIRRLIEPSRPGFVYEDDAGYLCIALGGYLFHSFAESDITGSFTSDTSIYAGIRVENLSTSYSGTSIPTLVANSDNDPDGEANHYLDTQGGDFTGIKFSNSNATTSGADLENCTHIIKVFERANTSAAWVIPTKSQLKFTSNEIEDRSSGKKISEQFTTNTVTSNNINAQSVDAQDGSFQRVFGEDIQVSETFNYSIDESEQGGFYVEVDGLARFIIVDKDATLGWRLGLSQPHIFGTIWQNDLEPAVITYDAEYLKYTVTQMKNWSRTVTWGNFVSGDNYIPQIKNGVEVKFGYERDDLDPSEGNYTSGGLRITLYNYNSLTDQTTAIDVVDINEKSVKVYEDVEVTGDVKTTGDVKDKTTGKVKYYGSAIKSGNILTLTKDAGTTSTIDLLPSYIFASNMGISTTGYRTIISDYVFKNIYKVTLYFKFVGTSNTYYTSQVVDNHLFTKRMQAIVAGDSYPNNNYRVEYSLHKTLAYNDYYLLDIDVKSIDTDMSVYAVEVIAENYQSIAQ